MTEEQAHSGEQAALISTDDALARYGDVPIAYAVFRVKLNDAGTEVVDTEYVFANQEYRNWAGISNIDLVGRSFLETAPDASPIWFPYCYRAAVLCEESHDTVYSPETNNWLSFYVQPSPIEGCCVFAFVKANEEHEARELLRAARETSDDIIYVVDALNDEMGYEASMNNLLEAMSRVIHPERLYIFERWEHTSSNTFEWCAAGVEPQKEMLQNLDNSEFATWDRMLSTDSVVVIPDVSAYKGVDDRLYELLTMQGIDRLLAVPFFDHGQLIGYMGADNYALDERLDTRRLLETVASFASARMANHRLMDKVEAARDTSDIIIRITNSLNGELSYDDAMNGLLETMSTLIHPERLYIFERWEQTSDNTFEWCAAGVEPQIEMLQNLDNSEFATWDRMLSTDSVVVIPDVSAYKGVDDRLYELLTMQGIDRLLAVPFYDRGELIGYLGADNYAVEERLDTRRLLEAVASFASARMANRRLMDTLEDMGIHDSLTGLLNRRGIDAAIQEHMAAHGGEPFAIALMDIDDFKSINDMYGHAVGDEALRVLANRLRNRMPNDALIGRNGGDEALVMLFGDSAQSIDSLMEGLVNSNLSFDLNGERYIITISVGYSWCDGSREDLAAAYSRADAALYSVKYNGKSGYRCYVEGMEARYRLQQGFASRNVADNLPEAALVFQPETGEIMFANDATVELLDFVDLYELMTFSQGTMMQLLHPDERLRMVEALEKQPEGKTRMQLRLLGKGGAEKKIAFSGKRVEMVNGKSAVYAVLFELD